MQGGRPSIGLEPVETPLAAMVGGYLRLLDIKPITPIITIQKANKPSYVTITSPPFQVVDSLAAFTDINISYH